MCVYATAPASRRTIENLKRTEEILLSVSRKTVVRLCAFCALMIAFSAAAYFPGIISVSADTGENNEGDNTLQYKQGCDMCLPPDTEKSGSNSQISERHISAADLVRTNIGLPVRADIVSESDYLMYILRTADTSVCGCDFRGGTVMRC